MWQPPRVRATASASIIRRAAGRRPRRISAFSGRAPLVGTLSANAAAFQHYDLVLAGDGATDRLEFRAADGTSLGGLLDNIALQYADNAGYQGGTITLGGITAGLVDTDGSETLALRVAGIVTGSVIADGVHTYTVDAADHGLADITGWNTHALTLTPPSTYSGTMLLDVQATASETADGSSATTHASLSLTIDDATLVSGGSGDDALTGGWGMDVLIGGAGNDAMSGGAGADVFAWSLGDQGTAGAPALDTVSDFDAFAHGDKLDLRDLLQGEIADPALQNLDNYLHFEKLGSDTIVHVSSSGGFAADSHSVGGAFTSGSEDQTISLHNVDLTAGLGTDQQIIQDLLNKGKLITD